MIPFLNPITEHPSPHRYSGITEHRDSAKATAALVLALSASLAAAEESPLFVDMATDAGLNFHHFNGMTGSYHFPEIVGAGGALFDFDNDGDLDIYLVQGKLIGKDARMEDAIYPPPKSAFPLQDRLFRNDMTTGADGSVTLRFTDVTESSKIRATGYGMGVATGDYDNDGWVDLYVTNYKSNQLWHNNGDGSFTDVTAASGTDDGRWSTSAAFLDYDRDGHLDLIVTNYVNYRVDRSQKCRHTSGRHEYCGPQSFDGEPDRLLHNRGDGTFEDVSGPAGLIKEYGSTLGVVVADFNRDRWPDIYIANDQMPNFFWINQKDGTFVNDALYSGTAVNAQGMAEASMGVDAGDFDNDGDEDLFMTHLSNQTNTLYLNDGSGFFEDKTGVSQLGKTSFRKTAWGTAMFDYDNDGWLDIVVVNGEVVIIEQEMQAGHPFPFEQTNQLFRNTGDGRVEDISHLGGAALNLKLVSRAAVIGDVDNDGDPDVLITNTAGPAQLLINQVGQSAAWIGLQLKSAGKHRAMLGARAVLIRTDAPALWRRARTDGSYCAANDSRVLFGLGKSTKVTALQVFWPDGKVEQFPPPPSRRYSNIEQGTGQPVLMP